jgi:hypothetical protein
MDIKRASLLGYTEDDLDREFGHPSGEQKSEEDETKSEAPKSEPKKLDFKDTAGKLKDWIGNGKKDGDSVTGTASDGTKVELAGVTPEGEAVEETIEKHVKPATTEKKSTAKPVTTEKKSTVKPATAEKESSAGPAKKISKELPRESPKDKLPAVSRSTSVGAPDEEPVKQTALQRLKEAKAKGGTVIENGGRVDLKGKVKGGGLLSKVGKVAKVAGKAVPVVTEVLGTAGPLVANAMARASMQADKAGSFSREGFNTVAGNTQLGNNAYMLKDIGDALGTLSSVNGIAGLGKEVRKQISDAGLAPEDVPHHDMVNLMISAGQLRKNRANRGGF